MVGRWSRRVLFEKGSGSELGVLVPIIEIFEGGWPWILVWPIGFCGHALVLILVGAFGLLVLR